MPGAGSRGSGGTAAAEVRTSTRAKRLVSQAMSRSARRAASCKAVRRACSAARAPRRLAAFQVENVTPGGTERARAFWRLRLQRSHRRRGRPRENSAPQSSYYVEYLVTWS